jgi:hypothetical protein
MDTTMMIVTIVAIALVFALVVGRVVARNKRSENLKRRFGGEYYRAMKEKGSRSRAEAELVSRTKRVERLEIHPLSANDHDRFAERWRTVQAAFVDHPSSAVSDAEKLVEEVMRVRGYPVVDFDLRTADLSVDHPKFVSSYREARELAQATERGEASTENLRKAIVNYRALFEDLLEPGRPAIETAR